MNSLATQEPKRQADGNRGEQKQAGNDQDPRIRLGHDQQAAGHDHGYTHHAQGNGDGPPLRNTVPDRIRRCGSHFDLALIQPQGDRQGFDGDITEGDSKTPRELLRNLLFGRVRTDENRYGKGTAGESR